MGERQALRIDYAHGTVPGTAFVIDEPFPIPQCAPRVPSAVSGQGGAAAGGVGLPSSGAWPEPPQRQPLPPLPPLPPLRGEEAPWRSLDWQQLPQQSFFPGSGRFRGEDGAARRPNGSYMRGPFLGRGGWPGGDMNNEGGASFRGGRGERQGMGGFRGRGLAGQRGGPRGGRGRGMGPDDTGGFRRGGDRGQRRPMNRGMRGDIGGQRGRDRGMRGRGLEEPRNRRPPPAPSPQGKPLTPKPPNKPATPGKGLTSQIPPPAKRPPANKLRNRFSGPDGSTPPPPGAKNNSTGGKPVQSATRAESKSDSAKGSSAPKVKRKSPLKDSATRAESKSAADSAKGSSASKVKSKSPLKDGTSKLSPVRTTSRSRWPGKSSSRPRSPQKSSSRNRSPGGRRSSPARSSSKSRSRRSRSRSRRRHRSRSRSPYKHRSRSRSPHRNRSPRVTRSPYRTSPLLPGQEEGFGIRVVGFPVRFSDVRVQDDLYHDFKRHGTVVSIDMYGCEEDRFAVVIYLLSTEREAALAAFKGHCFFGRLVHMEPWDSSAAGAELRSWENNASYRPLDERADEFHPRATKILFVGNLEKTLTREDLSTVFSRYGDVLGVDLKKMVGLPNRFAFIQYIDIAGVCRAIKAMDGELLRNTRLRLGFGRSKSTNCVWVDGLPATLTGAQLTAHFSAHGTVLKLSFDPSKGVALVFFKTVEQAEAALQEARGQTVGGNRIKVDFANARSQAAFYRVLEPGPEDGVDVEPEEKPAQEFTSSDIEAGNVLRKVLLV